MSEPGASSDLDRPGAPHPNDYNFRHHLRQTIILLGGRKEIADLLIRSQDYHISQSDIDELKKYNISLIEQLKNRLANIHKRRLRPKSR
jgi:hypothetical protein